jgi:hypothetical protein
MQEVSALGRQAQATDSRAIEVVNVMIDTLESTISEAVHSTRLLAR